MRKPKVSRQIVHWAIELSNFDINYKHWVAIKVQALANFIAKNTREEVPNEAPEVWELYTDGFSTEKGSDVRCVMMPLEGDPLTYSLVLTYLAIDNEVECEVLIIWLITKGAGVQKLDVKYYSWLVVK